MHAHTHIYARIHICTRMHIHTHIHICTHTCIHTHTHAHMHKCTHMHASMQTCHTTSHDDIPFCHWCLRACLTSRNMAHLKNPVCAGAQRTQRRPSESWRPKLQLSSDSTSSSSSSPVSPSSRSSSQSLTSCCFSRSPSCSLGASSSFPSCCSWRAWMGLEVD